MLLYSQNIRDILRKYIGFLIYKAEVWGVTVKFITLSHGVVHQLKVYNVVLTW